MSGARSIIDFGGLTLATSEIDAAALALDIAERSREQIGLLSQTYLGMTMDDAYAIQAAWVRRKVGNGDRVVGWKIGLTSKAMQAALAIDIPDSGVLLGSMMLANRAIVARGRFIQPRVEAEIAFVMKGAIDPANCSPETILAATDHIAPALEILDTRIVRRDPATGNARTICDTIADNAANAGIIMGEPVRDFAGLDLRHVGAAVLRNSEVEETGLGAGVLGDPLVSVMWLVERLAAHGDCIEAGQVVLSGSFVRPVEASSPSEIVGDFGALGRVSCTFS